MKVRRCVLYTTASRMESSAYADKIQISQLTKTLYIKSKTCKDYKIGDGSDVATTLYMWIHNNASGSGTCPNPSPEILKTIVRAEVLYLLLLYTNIDLKLRNKLHGSIH